MLALLSRTAGRRVAVLGGMYELGPESEEVHRRAGAQAAAAADLVVAVGSPHGDWIADGASAAGLTQDRLMRAADADAAGPLLASLVEPGDVVLLKASRGVGLERVVDHLGEVG